MLAESVVVVFAPLTPTHIFWAAERHLVTFPVFDASFPFPGIFHEAMLGGLSRTRSVPGSVLLGLVDHGPRHVPLNKGVEVKVLDPLRICCVAFLRL